MKIIIRKTIFNSFLIVTLFCIISSCGKNDTCNEKLGATFRNIQVDTVYKDTTNNVNIKLKMAVLDILPDSYFNASFILGGTIDNNSGKPWNNSWNMLDTIYVNKQFITIFLNSKFTPDKNEELPLFIHLHFGDRMNYIDCEHSASASNYYLDMEFNLKNSDSVHFEISNFIWKETYQAGHW